MTDAKPELVVNISDVAMYPSLQGFATGFPVFKFRNNATEIFSRSLGCLIKSVLPGQRAPLFSAMHISEETGFIVSGSGEYRAGDHTFKVRTGDILLAPEDLSGKRYEIVNTGAEELKFLAIEARTRRVNLMRQERAREVIEGYIKRRWQSGVTMNWEGYDFDGRVLSTYDREFRMLITFDQFGTVWVNGSPLADASDEDIDTRIGKLCELEKVLSRQHRESKKEDMLPISTDVRVNDVPA